MKRSATIWFASTLAAVSVGLLLSGSPAAADGYERHRPHYRGVHIETRSPHVQWYVGEYPYPFGSVGEAIYPRGCRTGWWQSSSSGHPRPQWASYCRR